MTGEELQSNFSKRLRELFLSPCAQGIIDYISAPALSRDGTDYFTVGDGSYNYTITVTFEDPQ